MLSSDAFQKEYTSIFSLEASLCLGSSLESIYLLQRAFSNESWVCEPAPSSTTLEYLSQVPSSFSEIYLITNRAQEFVKVLDISIAVTEAGFKVCDDVMFLSVIQSRSINTRERQAHLRRMHQWAKKGIEDTQRVYDRFVDLSISVGTVNVVLPRWSARTVHIDARNLSSFYATSKRKAEYQPVSVQTRVIFYWDPTTYFWLPFLK